MHSFVSALEVWAQSHLVASGSSCDGTESCGPGRPPVSARDGIDWRGSRTTSSKARSRQSCHSVEWHEERSKPMRRHGEAWVHQQSIKPPSFIMRLHEKALGWRHLIKSGPFSSCHGMESRGARHVSLPTARPLSSRDTMDWHDSRRFSFKPTHYHHATA